MRKLPLFLALAVLFLAGSTGQAARLTCTGSANQPNADLLGFDFDTNVPVSSGGGGSGSGKPSYSVTVQLPLDSSFETIYSIASEAKHVPSCTLTKAAGSSTITVTMTDVLFSDVQMINGPAFNNGVTGSALQLVLTFAKITVQTTP